MDIYLAKCKYNDLHNEYLKTKWYLFKKRWKLKNEAKKLYKSEGLDFKH